MVLCLFSPFQPSETFGIVPCESVACITFINALQTFDDMPGFQFSFNKKNLFKKRLAIKHVTA